MWSNKEDLGRVAMKTKENIIESLPAILALTVALCLALAGILS